MDRRMSNDRLGEKELTRRYGHGVYFAAESTISMQSYARASMFMRDKADFKVSKATALVELGELHLHPSTKLIELSIPPISSSVVIHTTSVSSDLTRGFGRG
jgi:hypothetical protein